MQRNELNQSLSLRREGLNSEYVQSCRHGHLKPYKTIGYKDFGFEKKRKKGVIFLYLPNIGLG